MNRKPKIKHINSEFSSVSESKSKSESKSESATSTIDMEINFRKQAIETQFKGTTMKQIKLSMNVNNFKKFKLLTSKLIENNCIQSHVQSQSQSHIQPQFQSHIHNCLLYSIIFSKIKISKKIINYYYKKSDIAIDINIVLDINYNHGEIFKHAIYYNRFELFELLITNGIDIHIEEEYALIKYCLDNNEKIVKLLVDSGADVHTRDCMCLVQAIGNGFVSVVNIVIKNMNKIMIDMGSVIMSNFDIALASAVAYNRDECVSLLINKGADISTNDYEIVMAVAIKGNCHIMKIFLECGLDLNICDGAILKKAIKSKNYELVEMLVNFEIEDKYICNLSADDSVYLRWATIDGNEQVVKLLLESLDKNGKKRCDITALDYDVYRLANKYNHLHILPILDMHKI